MFPNDTPNRSKKQVEEILAREQILANRAGRTGTYIYVKELGRIVKVDDRIPSVKTAPSKWPKTHTMSRKSFRPRHLRKLNRQLRDTEKTIDGRIRKSIKKPFKDW